MRKSCQFCSLKRVKWSDSFCTKICAKKYLVNYTTTINDPDLSVRAIRSAWVVICAYGHDDIHVLGVFTAKIVAEVVKQLHSNDRRSIHDNYPDITISQIALNQIFPHV